MKKKKFSLYGKIVLLTGLLTFLTVSLSLSVSLLISYKTTKNSYIDSCELMTDGIESAFTFNTADENNLAVILKMLIEHYETVRDNYEELTDPELTDYQNQLRLDLFGPGDDEGFGMTMEKAARKAFYSESLSRMQFLCNSYQVPFSSLTIYDVEKHSMIKVISSNIDISDNFYSIGRKAQPASERETDFFEGDEDFKTFIINNSAQTYNLVNINLENTNYKCFVQGHYPFKAFNDSFTKQIVTELLITFGSALFLVIIYAIFTKFSLLKNVKQLSESTSKFVNMMKNDEPLEIVDSNVKSNDEIRDLSDEFLVMQDQIINYVNNIREAKSIEEAFNAEVGIASRIQLESLPAATHFDKNIELRAFIKPAKGVGGDFYDYFYIDNDHLAVVIGDVSGKGIPASLFMMRSKESIRSSSMNESDLAKVFFKVNNSLCVNNKEGFFVTAFLGILNLKTYEFDFVNAGHERPFIKNKDKYERLEAKSNFVLGIEEDFVYEPQKIKLKEGDSIVLYTDGLNEAINSEKEEFGYERIAASLNKEEELKNKIDAVLKDLNEFEGNEEQFDDITILSFEIKKNITSYSYLNPTYEDIEDLTMKVETYLKGLDENTLGKIGVVIDDVMNNIISYGKTKANKTLTVSVEKSNGRATLIFVDNSHPFNPLLKEIRTVQENMDEGIVGGLGISIVKSISKETEYTYSNNKNILIIKF